MYVCVCGKLPIAVNDVHDGRESGTSIHSSKQEYKIDGRWTLCVKNCKSIMEDCKRTMEDDCKRTTSLHILEQWVHLSQTYQGFGEYMKKGGNKGCAHVYRRVHGRLVIHLSLWLHIISIVEKSSLPFPHPISVDRYGTPFTLISLVHIPPHQQF